MPGSTTRTKARARDAVTFGALQYINFPPVSVTAASQVASTIQTSFTLPFSAKIFGASISIANGTYTAATGANFNIVAGTGTYETAAGVPASVTATVAGTIASGQTLSVIFYVPIALMQAIGAPAINSIGLLGIAVVAGTIPVPVSVTLNATTGASATAAAAALALAINQNQITSNLIYATSAAGVLTFTFLQAGTAANSTTYTASATGTATITASGTFVGGTATTGVVAGVNDQFEYLGAYNYAPAGSTALGATPIFNADMPILPLGMAVGANPYIASNWDVIYQQGSIMTLRIIGTTLTYTNLVATLAYMPFDIEVPNPQFATFDPHLSLG